MCFAEMTNIQLLLMTEKPVQKVTEGFLVKNWVSKIKQHILRLQTKSHFNSMPSTHAELNAQMFKFLLKPFKGQFGFDLF